MKISNPPNSAFLTEFKKTLDAHGGPAKQCRFAVKIHPVKNNQLLARGYSSLLNDMVLLCESVEFPSRGMDYVEARYYGPNIQMPTNSKYAQQADLVFICRTQSYERQMFDDWMEIINPSQTFDFNYLDQYESEIQIFQFSDYESAKDSKVMEPEYQWTLLRAYPLQVHAQPVTWTDQDILKLAVTFSYRYWFRPGIDDQGVTQGRITGVNP